MFALLKARLGSAFRTKVGIALIGALVLVGGGTAMAMATSHGQFLSPLAASGTSASPTAHADDQDDQACTGSANGTPTGAAASPTAHADDGSDDRSGTPSATKVAGKDDQEGNENENAQEEQNETECAKSNATRTPEPTEGPEGAHTPGPTPTKGPGND
ncbi:MAG TPA: hypothetical protein VE258_11215 [Ktedonobacterales bacterium]|nr:hypothetical protein [Ktedonobacterales bacterium]